MLIKQIVKTLPLVVKAETTGKETYITVVFMGKNFVRFKLAQKTLYGIRNFIEEIYQESLDSYKKQNDAARDRVQRFKHYNNNTNGKLIDTGYIGNSKSLQNVNNLLPTSQNNRRVLQ